MFPKRNKNGQIICPGCDGEGKVAFEEGDRRGMDACYKCGTTGVIDEEQWRSWLILMLAEDLAYTAESARRKAIDEGARTDGEGEDYAFMAAENMMHAHDYFQSNVMALTDRFSKDLSKLDPETVDAILLLRARNEPTETKEPKRCASCGQVMDAEGGCQCKYVGDVEIDEAFEGGMTDQDIAGVEKAMRDHDRAHTDTRGMTLDQKVELERKWAQEDRHPHPPKPEPKKDKDDDIPF